MSKKTLFISAIISIATILAIVGGYIFWYLPNNTCPVSCDDGNTCTEDICSEATDYKCEARPIANCCGNKTCESSETYESCFNDCPNCNDNNKCTDDFFDYHTQKCANAPNLESVCCGNTICEVGETYEKCAKDCQNCVDDNVCTKDSYDYHLSKCVNEIIIPCCGNTICDSGVEKFSNCANDCPNCDDNNKLTVDSFNYTSQKCENPVTRYFFDDFEAGTPQGWDFYNAVDGGLNPSAWTLIADGNNTVLKGVNHNFADISGKGWNNYNLKLKFKKISGSLQINFRNNFFVPEEITHRYILRLEEGGNHISLAKGLNENKGEYQELAHSSALFGSGWHTLEIRAYNNIFNIYLDGNLLIKYKDTQNPFLSGKINFETGDNTVFLFDNVEIKLIIAQGVMYP